MKHQLCFAATALILVSGCRTNSRPMLIPVSGQVFLEHKPAHNAVVWLHPIGASELGTRRPHGTVDKDGNFEISTYKAGDGAPTGRYRVAIYLRSPPTSGDEDGESLIPEHYMDPEFSGLAVVEVEQDPLILPPFQLMKN